ncbi:MAG: HEPN domain protein [Lentisphaerae bacterium ADurb.BinA184]|nr:MAG: HEPN domain protein [Lentisphaerae bacterium ADurb.BinA184]
MDELHDAQRWMEYARDDLRAAACSLQADPPLLRHVTYNCQQCVEKALKAVLIRMSRRFQPTHDLTALAAELLDVLPGLRERLADLDWLKNWVVMARYPMDCGCVRRADAKRAMALATEMLDILAETGTWPGR